MLDGDVVTEVRRDEDFELVALDEVVPALVHHTGGHESRLAGLGEELVPHFEKAGELAVKNC